METQALVVADRKARVGVLGVDRLERSAPPAFADRAEEDFGHLAADVAGGDMADHRRHH